MKDGQKISSKILWEWRAALAELKQAEMTVAVLKMKVKLEQKKHPALIALLDKCAGAMHEYKKKGNYLNGVQGRIAKELGISHEEIDKVSIDNETGVVRLVEDDVKQEQETINN